MVTYSLYNDIQNNLFLTIITNNSVAHYFNFKILTISFEEDNTQNNLFINNKNYIGNIYFCNTNSNFIANLCILEKYKKEIYIAFNKLFD